MSFSSFQRRMKLRGPRDRVVLVELRVLVQGFFAPLLPIFAAMFAHFCAYHTFDAVNVMIFSSQTEPCSFLLTRL